MKSLIKYLSNVFRSGGGHAQSQASFASSKLTARKKEERTREHKERARNVYRRALLHSARCSSLTEKAIIRSKNELLRRRVAGWLDATSDAPVIEVRDGEILSLEMNRKAPYRNIDMEKTHVSSTITSTSTSTSSEGCNFTAGMSRAGSGKNASRSRSVGSSTTWDFVRNRERKKEHSLKKSRSDSGIEYEAPSLSEPNGADFQLKESPLCHVLLKNKTVKDFKPYGEKQYSSYRCRRHDQESSNPIYIARRSNDPEIQFDENPCGTPNIKPDPDIIRTVRSLTSTDISRDERDERETEENPCGRPAVLINFSDVPKSSKITSKARKVSTKKCKTPDRKQRKGKKKKYPWDVSSRKTTKRSRTKVTDQSATVLKLKKDLDKNSTTKIATNKKSGYPWRSGTTPEGSKSFHTRQRSSSCSDVGQKRQCQCPCGCVMCAFGTKCKITPTTCKKHDDRPQACERPRDILCQICHIFSTEGEAGLRSYFRDCYKNKEYYMYTDASYYDVHQHLKRTRNRQPDCRKKYEARFGNTDETDD